MFLSGTFYQKAPTSILIQFSLLIKLLERLFYGLVLERRRVILLAKGSGGTMEKLKLSFYVHKTSPDLSKMWRMIMWNYKVWESPQEMKDILRFPVSSLQFPLWFGEEAWTEETDPQPPVGHRAGTDRTKIEQKVSRWNLFLFVQQWIWGGWNIVGGVLKWTASGLWGDQCSAGPASGGAADVCCPADHAEPESSQHRWPLCRIL